MPIIINKDYAKQIYVTKFDIDFVVQNILFIPNPAFRYHKRGKAYDFRIVIFFFDRTNVFKAVFRNNIPL